MALTIRRAQASDATDLANLAYPDKTLQRIIFGRGHVAALIETSFLALTAEALDGSLVAFLVVNDRAPSELAEDVDYLDYVLQHYAMETPDAGLVTLSAQRTLFLSYFVQATMDHEVFRDMLLTVYQLLTHVEWLVLPIPSSVEPPEVFLGVFFKATRTSSLQTEDDTYASYDVFLSHAKTHLPSVHVRKANIEDHDDLEPILVSQNHAFGDYFLAELIASQTNHSACLVAEDNGRAVGLLAATDEVDLAVLRDSFDLAVYNDLLKPMAASQLRKSPSRLQKLLKRRTSPKIVVFGPPGCGKSTQSDHLVATYGVVALSPIALAHAAGRRATPLGKKIQRHLDRHEELPNEILLDLVSSRIHDTDCVTQGWVLDGYPTSEAQVWDLLKRGIKPDVVIVLHVPDDAMHKTMSPDDVARFHLQAASVLKCYAKETALVTVDGSLDRDAVSSAIAHALGASDKTKGFQSVKQRQQLSRDPCGPPKFVICGPPAGGKGTQCELLVREYGVVHLSTGDMLRSAIQAGTEVGFKAKAYMDAGDLVPDELIVHVILDRLQESDCTSQGWLLDGFPRTAAQAEAMLSEGIVPHLVIVLDVPDDEVVKRISGRRVDLDTGKTYHLVFNPPPSELKDKVVQRSDDTEETIRVRLATFHANCGAVVAAFHATSTILNVDGMQPKDIIASEITAAHPKPKPPPKPTVATATGPPKLLICGPPAGGKGTQCELLVKEFGVVHLSTGDMLRSAISANSELGLTAKSYMDAGKLVPDELIVKVILSRLQSPDCSSKGWLLDGFPRTAAQAQAMLALGIVPDVVIVLQVPDDEVVGRISGRRVEVATGKTYHIVFNPPPPDVIVVQRSDDTEETIRVRLGTYHENCGAVVDCFQAQSTILSVDGLQPKDAIAAKVIATVNAVTNPLKAPPLKLIICGPPAGGKGTQCEKLVAQYGVVHISTGDMLRSAIAAGTDLGRKAKGFMDRGELVPDDLIMDTLLDRLTQQDCVSRGWLLDGFPRNEAQARALVASGIVPDVVLVLDVADDEVIQRISGRRVDVATGKTYHVVFNPPPPGVNAVQRSDDNEATVKIRLKTYHLNVAAVLRVFAPLSHVASFNQPSTTEMTFAILRTIEDTRAKVDVQGNAFIVTLFCVDTPYTSISSAFLRPAFALFQHKEYCVVTLPPGVAPPLFLAPFALVPAKPTSTYSHVLYLLHRDAVVFLAPEVPHVLRIARFRMTEPCDALSALVETLSPTSIADIETDMALAAEEDDIDLEDNPKHVLFVARLHGTVVGLASLARDSDVTSGLKHFFDVEQFVSLTHHRAKDQAMLSHFLLNPLYAVTGPFFLQEIMRLFRKTCLFASVPRRGHVSPLVAESFVLAPARRQVVTSSDTPMALTRLSSNALYFFTKRLLSEPKTLVTARIVVVGASDAGLTVLKQLLGVPYLRLTNVTLVAPHGLEVPAPDVAPLAPPSIYSPTDLDQTGIPTHVRVVTSRLVQIDRAAKAIVLLDNSCLPYDLLVLATGLTDTVLPSLRLVPEYDGESYVVPPVPRGVVVLEDASSAKKVHETLRAWKRAKKIGRVIVVGTSAYAATLVHAVRDKLGASAQISWLCAGAVDDDGRIREHVESMQPTLIVGITNLVAPNGVLEGITIQPPTPNEVDESGAPLPVPPVRMLPCDLLLCCDRNDVDPDAFRAINDSGLVFDGRLVVNASFQTSDPCIYAGGSLCRFSRRFPKALYQQCYSARECGELLAKSLLRVVDPIVGATMDPTPSGGSDASKPRPPPAFTQPKIVVGHWTGDLHYVRIQLPDVPTSFKSLATENREMQTYCCLQFDDFGVLSRLTYLGRDAVNVTNLACLVGLHEAYLNCAISSFHQNLVTDWIEFFSQKWAIAVYHDRFLDFCSKLTAASQYDEGVRLAIDSVHKQFKDGGDVMAAMALAQTQVGRGGASLAPTTKKMLELKLLEHLSVNRDVLTMYFLPRAAKPPS
ncbi:hypothetical protein SPRG_13198 [Saprolegnia parasitica CBS 223.65]|uniref:Uncharacterized protein n=1 Tax=Saprolegnia parasitica (strain CBS 223.65) TaxID=695850 RepID=A0A067C436_SAPPC|nr:hypothetical protein SPRG_13198 [Saprolegnia parasitica CBS 223.65]KDO21306.1 hypothetical protein SPRG_13198 [Saprolegnia parasitica CBS 223.65]|eukprot:XP_012207962.1 hypothetical protein SPRG_13198 [Saprolegnia parasitica CBS 223.65]